MRPDERPIPEEWVRAACDVMAGPTDDLSDSEWKALEHDARAVIAAVRPLIEEAGRERIAQEVENIDDFEKWEGWRGSEFRTIAAAIREGGRDA